MIVDSKLFAILSTIKVKIAELETQLNNISVTRPTEKRATRAGTVPYDDFITLLQEKYPYHPKYGMKRALLDYNRKERADGKTDLKIDEGTEQLWRRNGKVPGWAMAYLRDIERLPKRPAPKYWKPAEIQFLKYLIVTCPDLSYIEMADICTKEFHRQIGENAIKGTTDRFGFGKMSQA